MKNLWSNLETLTSELKNPIDIIRAQSDYLREGTNGLLCILNNDIKRLSPQTAEVLKHQKIVGQFKYKVVIASDYLPDYSFNFMSLFYDITFYPLLVTIPRDIADDIEKESTFTTVFENEIRKYYNVNNQDELERILEVVFNCEKIRTVLQNMKSIIGDVESED